MPESNFQKATHDFRMYQNQIINHSYTKDKILTWFYIQFVYIYRYEKKYLLVVNNYNHNKQIVNTQIYFTIQTKTYIINSK